MGLRSAYKPQTSSNVSGVVVFLGKDETAGVAYVRFNPKLEEMLGKKMPMGVGPQTPAFLKVMWNGWLYEVRGCYLHHQQTEVLLWNSSTVPKWCKPRVARGQENG